MDTVQLMELTAQRKKLLQGGQLRVAVQDGTLLSAFVPVLIHDRLYEAAFLYYGHADTNGTVPRPHAHLLVDSATGQLLRYAQCEVEDFVDTAEHPRDQRVRIIDPSVSLQQRMANGQRLLAAYEAIRPFALHPAQQLTPEQAQQKARFREAFDLSVPAEMAPFYRALSPMFFDWLQA